MATLKTNLIEPEGATTTLTVGESGGSLIVGADALQANVAKSREIITAFTSTGATTWTCPAGVTSVEVLVVAGGGGSGGRYYSGGGGGGGVVHDATYTVVPAVVYDLTVGGGGTKGGSGAPGSAGTDSTWNDNAEGSGVKYIAKGGGGGSGGDAGDAATAGGSGGGRNWAWSGSSGPTSPDTGGTSNQQSAGTASVPGGVTSYGNVGGGDSTDQAETSGTGGGGAGAAGENSTGLDVGQNRGGGNGGVGVFFNSFAKYGDNGYFAGGGGGGGGGGTNMSISGYGGLGGGGKGGGYAGSNIFQGTPGRDGTGGGGGGVYGNPSPGTAAGLDGGDGIILLKYSNPAGSTVFQSDGSGNISNQQADFGGPKVLLSTQTASNSASISFTTGIDSTYNEYVFDFINIRPATDGSDFRVNFGSGGGPTYGMNISSTFFVAYQDEAGTQSGLSYDGSKDLADASGPQGIMWNMGNDSDAAGSGTLHCYGLAGTTYVKNFTADCINYDEGNTTAGRAWHGFTAGYVMSATAVTAVQFAMEAGNIAAGTIKMYGIR